MHLESPSSLRYRLLHAEEEFLLALTEGDVALDAFYHTWSKLQHDVEDTPEEEIISLAFDVASRIAILAETSIDLYGDLDALTVDMTEDLESIMSQVEVSDLSPDVCLSPSPATKAAELARVFPMEIYMWILANLHDPYPTSSTKTDIADAIGAPSAIVSEWFESARHEIGWTSLRIQRFHGSRKAIVKAATNFIQSGLTVDRDTEVAFMAIKAKAQTLLSSYVNTGRGELAEAKSSPQIRQSPNACPSQPASRPSHRHDAASLSSSPQRKSVETPRPKKRSMDARDSDEGSTAECLGVLKRQRLQSWHRDDSVPSAIPSHASIESRVTHEQPACRTPSILSIPKHAPSGSAHPQQLLGGLLVSTQSRKRRSSDTIAHESKRPRIQAYTRAVSDPLPSTNVPLEEQAYNIHDWYNTVFDAEVSTVAPDPSVPLMIEVFDWASFDCTSTRVEQLKSDGTLLREREDYPTNSTLAGSPRCSAAIGTCHEPTVAEEGIDHDAETQTESLAKPKRSAASELSRGAPEQSLLVNVEAKLHCSASVESSSRQDNTSISEDTDACIPGCTRLPGPRPDIVLGTVPLDISTRPCHLDVDTCNFPISEASLDTSLVEQEPLYESALVYCERYTTDSPHSYTHLSESRGPQMELVATLSNMAESVDLFTRLHMTPHALDTEPDPWWYCTPYPIQQPSHILTPRDIALAV